MELARAFTFAFEDAAWQRKLGILLLLALVPGLNIIMLIGYSLTIAHNLIHAAERPLPEWADWGDIAARGLMGAAASLAYYAPLIGLFGLGALLNAASRGSLGTLLALLAVPVAALYVLLAACLLTAAHLAYARSDHSSDYYHPGARVREALRGFGRIFPVALVQLGLTAAALILTPLLIPTLIGPFIVWCGVSVAGGYLWAELALSLR